MRQYLKIQNQKQLHEHWTKKGCILKPKKQFNTLEEANNFISENKKKNYHPYICSDCGLWHIGHKK